MSIKPRSNSRFVQSTPILTRDGNETFGIAKKFRFLDANQLEESEIGTYVVTSDTAKRLDQIAIELYGNQDLMSIVPMFNHIQNPLNWPLNGQVIKYPLPSVVFAEL